jgi:hypothetical protein
VALPEPAVRLTPDEYARSIDAETCPVASDERTIRLDDSVAAWLPPSCASAP